MKHNMQEKITLLITLACCLSVTSKAQQQNTPNPAAPNSLSKENHPQAPKVPQIADVPQVPSVTSNTAQGLAPQRGLDPQSMALNASSGNAPQASPQLPEAIPAASLPQDTLEALGKAAKGSGDGVVGHETNATTGASPTTAGAGGAAAHSGAAPTENLGQNLGITKQNTVTVSQSTDATTLQQNLTKESPEKNTILSENSAATNLTQSLFMVGGLLLFFAASGVILVKLKQKGAFSATSAKRNLEIMESLALGNKRSISLIRVRNEEFVIANTEQGISLLLNKVTEVTNSPDPTLPATNTQIEVRPKITARDLPKRAIANESGAEQKSQKAIDEAVSHGEARRNLLSAAIQNLKNKRVEPEENAKRPAAENKPSTPSPNQQHFPKYLANAFQQESNRKLPPKETTARTNQHEEQKLEDVTNLIREKLKEMKPLS